MSSESFPDKDHWQKTADRYLDVARTSASRTSTIVLLWFVAIILCYADMRHQIFQHEEVLKEAKGALIKESSGRNYAIKEIEKIKEDKKDTADHHDDFEVYGKSEDQETTCEEELNKKTGKNWFIIQSCREKGIKYQIKELDAKRSAPVKFQFPPIEGFDVPLFFAPAVLSLIILLLVMYLTFIRNRTFRYLGRALRIQRDNLGVSIEKIGDVLSPRHWWLAPLPQKPGTLVTADEFAIALGWRYPSQASSILIFLFWLALILLQFDLIMTHITLQQSLYKNDYIAEYLKGEIPFMHAFSAAYFIVLGMTASYTFWWFRPGVVPDDIPNPDTEIQAERRQLLVHLSAGFTMVLIANSGMLQGLKYRVSRFAQKRIPRYRTRRSLVKTPGLPGLLLNGKSNVVHFTNRGQIVGIRDLNPSTLWRLEINALFTKPDTYLNRSVISVASEYIGKEFFEKNQVEDGLNALMRGIEQDLSYKKKAGLYQGVNTKRKKPRKKRSLFERAGKRLNSSAKGAQQQDVQRYPVISLRLYDLFAKEAVRANKPESIRQLIVFIKENGLADAFKERITKWTNPESKWYRDLSKYGLRSSNVG